MCAKINPMSSQNNNTQNPSPFRAGADKLNTARLLYMAGDTTQRSIAKTLKVSERTVYSWIKNEGWDRLRQAARQAPAVIAENIFSQIVELQNDIASREEGKRYPTMQEAELTRKLVLSVDKMKNAPALSQSMQVLRMFRSFANSYGDRDFRLTLNRVMEHFLEGEAKNGYMPYQVEYGPAETPEPELPEVDLELPADKEEGKTSEAPKKDTAETRSEQASTPASDTQLAPEKVGSKSEVPGPSLTIPASLNADSSIKPHPPQKNLRFLGGK
ncbi:MAG: hypothetical protein KF744_00760 [Taibaiella sp.]|nr:hypothetical protein [Taibaiella sp.]